MAYDDPTANYGWNLPDEDGDTNDWGRLLNEIFGNDSTGIDAVLQAVSDVADAALPRAGGTMTGDLIIGANTRLYGTAKSDALSIDWENGNFFYLSLSSGNNDIVFDEYPANGKVQFIVVEVAQPIGGDGTITWPNEVQWSEGTEPTLSTDASGKDIFVFYTRDAGTNVYGAHSIQEPA